MAPSVSYSIIVRLADVVSADEIGPHNIIPPVFRPDVASSVAVAVRDAAPQNPAR
jgi:malate dehydrogenase (oxaloacetate-decarboxylating)